MLMSSATGMIVMKASSSQGNNVSASSVVATDESKKSLEQLKSLKAGDLLANGAFRVEKVEPVPDYQVVSVSLKHVKTGAHWLHIGADDSNNAFNVGFKTVPMDDTGVRIFWSTRPCAGRTSTRFETRFLTCCEGRCRRL